MHRSEALHTTERQLHTLEHEEETQHPDCHSLSQITEILKGTSNTTTPPLPDVLASPTIMPPAREHPGTDLHMVFEGRCRIDDNTRDIPRTFCPDTQHYKSVNRQAPNVSFDINSTICFPTSLAMAKQGIFMYNTYNGNLSLKGSIHFATMAADYNSKGKEIQKLVPLHLLPSYCFGTVNGADGMLLHVFFPNLRIGDHNGYNWI
jgi:hypothetical protein